jgi:hypothetical protein
MAVRLSALHAARPLPPGRFLVLISVRGWVNPRGMVTLEGLGQLKNAVTSSGIKFATFRLVALCLNQLRYRVPSPDILYIKIWLFCFLWLMVDIIEGTQCYEISSLILPICAVATTAKAVCKYCRRGFRCDLNPHSQPVSFLITWANFNFVIWVLFCFLSVLANICYNTGKEDNHIPVEERVLLLVYYAYWNQARGILLAVELWDRAEAQVRSNLGDCYFQSGNSWISSCILNALLTRQKSGEKQPAVKIELCIVWLTCSALLFQMTSAFVFRKEKEMKIKENRRSTECI